MENDFYRKICNLIEDNLEKEDFSVEELSKCADMSRSMLHRKLKQISGKSATELITEIRLERAKELLIKSEFTSAQIAYKVGFSSPSYFNKVFKKHFQTSPGEIRKGKELELNKQNNKKYLQIGKIKTPVLIVIILLIAVIVALSGIHIFNGKENRAAQSIAILPFNNLSSLENTQFFADGIVEDLLTRLSTIEDLKVISRTSSEMFREKGDKTVPEIGKLLDVGYILEGSVQRDEDDIRISVQLINAETDHHVLSKQYDRSLDEIFKVQREIAMEIASVIAPVLSEQQLNKLKLDRTQNIKALQLYQIGRFHSSKRTTEEFKKGIEYYKQAIAEDPFYGLAYAGLADNYHLMAIQGRMDKTEGIKLALEMAEKALELDPNLAEAYTVFGGIYTFVDSNWKAAEKEFLKAIELNPNYSTAHQYYAEYLTIMGNDEDARKHINQAMELDPFSFIVRYRSGRIYYDQEQFNEALDEIKVCLDLNKMHPWANSLEYDIYLSMEDGLAAVECMKRGSVIWNLWTPEEVDSVFLNGGLDGMIRWNMSFTTGPEYLNSIFYAMLGEDEKAMDMLELAMVADRLSPSRTIQCEYKNLRSNPRFIAIREQMGLPPLEP